MDTNTEANNVETTKPEDDLEHETDLEGFRIVNKRAFMRTGNTKYLLPSDVEERNRLDQQHYIIRYHLRGNFNAPLETELEKGIHVIDVGCGSGRWTLEMAEEYPNSVFVGIDCANVFPKEVTLPNCSFMQANTLEGLPFKDDTFDYVFQRLMMFAFTPDDWRVATRELARIAKPGGMIELMESELKMERPPSAYTPFYNGALATMAARGIDLSILQHLPKLLAEAGLENVQNEAVSCPMGWGGKAGNLSLIGMGMLFVSLKPAVRVAMGVSDDEYDDIVVQCTKGFKEEKSWGNLQSLYAQKPMREIITF